MRNLSHLNNKKNVLDSMKHICTLKTSIKEKFEKNIAKQANFNNKKREYVINRN